MKSDFLRTLMIGVYLLGAQAVNADPLPRDEQPKRPPVLVKPAVLYVGPRNPDRPNARGLSNGLCLFPSS